MDKDQQLSSLKEELQGIKNICRLSEKRAVSSRNQRCCSIVVVYLLSKFIIWVHSGYRLVTTQEHKLGFKKLICKPNILLPSSISDIYLAHKNTQL